MRRIVPFRRILFQTVQGFGGLFCGPSPARVCCKVSGNAPELYQHPEILTQAQDWSALCGLDILLHRLGVNTDLEPTRLATEPEETGDFWGEELLVAAGR